MKFSYNWIHELTDGLGIDPPKLMKLITMKTAECEGVEAHAPWLAQVCVARVMSVEPIEGSHNVKALVDAGPVHGQKQVVCGAPNCRPGVLTAYVPSGVTVAGGKEIRKATIGGVESDGMLASGDELDLNRDHAGILELSGVEPGEPIPGCAPDAVIEVDNKSLTHRPDLWGHHGMAREVAAISGVKLKDPVDLTLIPQGEPAWHVDIRDFELCPRYSALVFENVKVGPSPLWLQQRLEAVGLNPISNVVDVTNFIMAELAQPMHAFDADWLHGNTIMVRRAGEGEVFKALNDESYTLNTSNLVIADANGAVALAGVIGGAGSAINDKTTRIVLESANFQAANIRMTSSAVKIRTDASMRFEKAQDPLNTVRALARAVALLQEVAPGCRLVGGLVDSWQAAAVAPPIELPMTWLVRKLGRPIGADEVRGILESLEFLVDETAPGVFSVTVPTWRATKDITIKDDLLEEVGRMIGYATVPPVAPLQPVKQPWVNEERVFHHSVRELVAAQGFTESYNYSFLSEDAARQFHFEPGAHLRVINPISSEQSLMRLSLLPGIHRNIVENAKRYEEFRLFEIGNEIHKRGPGELPNEVPHLMAALYSKGDGKAGLFELKRLAECVMPGCTVTPAEAGPNQHPARCSSIEWRGEAVGTLYELHPSLMDAGRAAILDVNLAVLFKLGPAPRRYKPLRRYPTSEFDLSVVAGLRDLCGTLETKIRKAAGPLCEKVRFLYAYQGKPLADDQQSLSFRVTAGAADHTLSNEEVTGIRNAIIADLASAGYELR
ncbi:phenylalanine--tRNA ligase subunit beta [Paludibaculum fermentans]|uniref:Phenylalanine--tRNA ligase beta subunit n=1 Tax=Paludibaculum fermentans TaxID=1473598 RepID=A0A7S7NYX2_PALFE|nr:phenylalanine--tRNA ligase subunit beta [Paludibaculum fermentans]QOY91769.1 phenylalanine--tRNA ligase subunit beta [Paludibaculum fermentans]